MNRYRHRRFLRSLSSISTSTLSPSSSSSSSSRLYRPQQEQTQLRRSVNDQKKSGLYGLVGLQAPRDFERLAVDAIDRVNDIISDIRWALAQSVSDP